MLPTRTAQFRCPCILSGSADFPNSFSATSTIESTFLKLSNLKAGGQTMLNGPVVVTGATSEIGRSIAVMLARAGLPITLLGRDHERLRGTLQACQTFGSNYVSLSADLTSPAEAIKAVASAQVFGPPRILIHAAGLFDWASADSVLQGYYRGKSIV
jgi:predicted amino acid dehydrogenase